jgi:hypothetical protein
MIPIFYKLLILRNKKRDAAIVKYSKREASGMGGIEDSPHNYGLCYISFR